MPDDDGIGRPVTLEDRIALVSERTVRLPYFVWDWGEAVAIQALMRTGDALDDRKHDAWVASRLDLWRQIHPTPFWPDHLGPGVALVWQYERTGNSDLRDYAERLAEHMLSLPMVTTGARLLRPDKPDIDHFVWVDSLYTDGPFLCELGRVTANAAYLDEGAQATEGICASLQDPDTALFAHRYDTTTHTSNGVFWGRGCGWAALGLGHTLAVLPSTHPMWNTLAHRLERFADRAAALQAPSGHWHAVLDRPETLFESSTTALIAEGLALAIDAGALDECYCETVERAWKAVAAEVTEDGCVDNVSQRSPSREMWEDYARLPHGGCYAWGQGAWLQLASRHVRAASVEQGQN